MKRTSIVIRTIYVIPSLFFKTILLTLPILIVLQDVSYALSPTSRFRPIEQLSHPPAALSQAETVSDVLKPQKEPDSDLRKNQETKPIVRMGGQIRPRILIVEDKKVWREKYKELLSKWGYEPEFAEYGRKAVKIFRENPVGFALVISDLDLNEELPEGVKDMPGEDVISEVRKIHAKIPIIVISARNYTGDFELINHDPILKSRFEAKPEILFEVLKECFHILPAANEPTKDKSEEKRNGDGPNLSSADLLIKNVSREDGAVLISLSRSGRAELNGKIPGDSEKESRDKEGWVKKLYLRWSIKRSMGKLDKEDNAFSRKRLVESLSEKLKRINPQDELFQSAVDKIREMAMLDNNPNVRKSAVVALGESGAKDAGKLLAVILREDPDPAMKYAAVEALERIGKTDGEIRKVLFEIFRETLPEDWEAEGIHDARNIDTWLITLRIILALTGLPLTDEHKRELDKLLRDIKKIKRGWYYLPMAKVATIALSRIHQLNPEVNMLEKKLKEEYLSFHPPFAITGRIDEIGLSIHNAIEEIQSESSRKAAEALCRGLDQLDVNPREAEKIFTEAIKAWFENKRAKKLIRESSVPTELALIAQALGFIGKSEEAVRALTILAGEDSGYYSISGKTIEALGRIGAESVVGKLKCLMNEIGISQRIIFAWGRIASPRAVEFLTKIIKRNGWLPCMEYFEEWKQVKESGYTYKGAWEALSLTGSSHRLELIAQKIQDHDRDWLSQFIAASIYNLRKDRGQIVNQKAARGLIFLWQSVVKDRFPDSKKKEDYALYSQLIYGLELGRLILGEKFYSFLSEAGVEKKDFLKPSVNRPVSREEGGITVNLYGLLSSKPTQDDAVLRKEFARRLGIPQEVNVRLEEKGQPIGSWQKAALSTGNYQIPILAYLPALAPPENKDISLLGVSLELNQIFFLLSPGDGYKIVLGLCARGKEFLHGTGEIIKTLERTVSEELSRKNIIVNEEEALLLLSKLLTRLKELRVVKEDARIYLVDENDKRIWEGLLPAEPGKMPRLGKILTIGSGKIKIYFEGIIWESVEKVKDIPGELINLLTLRQFKENLSEIALVHIEDTWRGIEGYQDILNKHIRSFKEVFNPINTIRWQGKSYKGIVENIYDALALLAEELGPLESIQVYQKIREAGISVLVNGKPLANPLKEGCFSGKFKAGDEITITPEITSASPEESFWKKIKREEGYAFSFVALIREIFVKKTNRDGSNLSSAASTINNASKEGVPVSPSAPAHVETTKLAVELKDIKKNLREKLFAMEEAREALVQILDEIIKEGLFPGGFVIRKSSKNTAKGAQIKKLRSELTNNINNPEDQEAIIAKVNFTMEAVRRIISKMQNKVKDDEMKDILGMQRRYDEIRNELVKENQGLVGMVVKDYLRNLGKKWEKAEALSDDLFQNDLSQAGDVGLISAIEGFDPNQGFEFSTYAVPAISRAIERELKQRLVGIPQDLWKEKSKIDKFTAKFIQTKKREPAVEEIATGLKLSVSRVKEILGAFKKPVSLENSFDEEDEEYSLLGLEHLSNRKIEPPPEDALIISEDTLIISEKLEQALRGLNEREREIIKLRYWLDYTLEEVGEILHISHGRVSQIERAALTKLRSYLRLKGSNPLSRKDTNKQVNPDALPIENVSKETVPISPDAPAHGGTMSDVLKPQKEPDSDLRKISGASLEESLRLFFKKIRDDFYRELAKISPEEIKTLKVCFPSAVLLSMIITQKYGLPLGRYEHTIDHQELLITGYKINDSGKISHQQHIILLLYLGGKAYYVDGTGADNGQFTHPDLEKVEIVFEKLESITREAIYKELEEKHNLAVLDPFLSVWAEALDPENMGDYVAFLRSLQLLFDIGDYPQSMAPLSEAAHRIATASFPLKNNQEEEKILAAQGALDYLLRYIAAIKIEDRAVVIGLGSGTTMKHFIGYIGKALKEGKLKNIIGVPTSKEIEKLAGENSVPLSNLEDNPVIDIYFDGADELNVRTLYSLKGAGGALTKEKEVMNKTKRVIILVDSTKLVEHTASKSPLYIEIEKPDSKLQDEIIKELNAIVPVNKKSYRLTQEGKHILAVDISYRELYKYTQSLPEIEEKINKISGVIDSGIFTRAPDAVIIGRKDKKADIIEVRKNKPIGNTHNLAEEINGIAIDRFTFIEIAENSTDEIEIDEEIVGIKEKIGGLFDQDKNIIFTPPFLYKTFTLAMLDTMFNNSDSFKGATVVDFGAGDGVLSLVALGLGAKQVILVEKNKDELEKAKIFLEARGWRKDTDFFIMPMDFAHVEFIEKIKNFKPTVALINIGPWAEYGSSNQTAVSIANLLPEVSLILNGGYRFELTSDDQPKSEFSYLQHHMETAGFTVSDSYYPPYSMHVLTARRLPVLEKVEKGKDMSSGDGDSRDLKPFFKKHELGFQNRVTVTVAASELKKLIIDKKAREAAIYAKIGKLNKTFPNGEIEIEKQIQTGVLKCSRKEYKYAVFNFKKEGKTINVLFLEDHTALTSDELKELRIQDIEKRRLDCPGLEGVWFINPDAAKAKSNAEFEKLPSRDAFVAREVLFNSLELTLHSLEGDYGNMTRSGLAFREFLSNKILSIDLADARSTQILDKTMRDVIDSLWQEIEKKFSKEDRTPRAINTYIGRRIGPLYNEISQRILAQIASFDTERPDNWRRIESYIKGKIADVNRDGVNIVGVVVYGSWPRGVAHSSSDVDCISILPERTAADNSLSSFIWSLNDGAPHKFHMLFGDFIDKPTYPNFMATIAGYSTRPAWRVIAANDSARLEIEAKLIASWHSLLAEDAQKLTASTILEKEINRIHDENFKYMPSIPEKTILCHIIVDSILPEGQRAMLKVLEQNMRDQSCSEKVASLTINEQDKFVDQLRALMARQRELYKDYTVNFDVACPNTDLVAAILGANLGIKALAFEPCKEADVAQVEGIILALRALNSGKIETLREAFKILAGKELPWELSGIADIDELIKRITFILPAAKVIDYSRMIRLNKIIRENIENAA